MINVQYIVVRRDIIDQYGIGFVAAQLCHASMAPISNSRVLGSSLTTRGG